MPGQAGITRNSWEGGQNTDVSKSLLNPSFYLEAHNLEASANGEFFALKNVRGTTLIENLIATPGTEVLGVFSNNYLIDNISKKCLTIFTATEGGNFKIWCYDVEADVKYEIYEEAIEDDYLTSDRVVDAIGYAENDVDYIYFVDDYKEYRFLKCEIPSPYSPNFLSASDLSLQRRGANGFVLFDSIVTGGSLLSGSYQFAYRMVDPVGKRFTKWSSLTLPFHVYSGVNSTSQPVFSDYGLPTSFKIVIDILPTSEELSSFDYFQLAVVENVFPTGPEVITDGQNQTFVASLLPIEATATYLAGIALEGYEFKTNAKIGVVPIEEIVVDLAAIKTGKTLNVKEKRLVGGNIKYHDLTFDNGNPTAGGSIITHIGALADLFSSQEESIFRGYFGDEVYRIGIVYKDIFGNRSPVKILDLNAITDNQISGGLPDVRFPSRSTSNTYSLFDGSGNLKSLGLHLEDIDNHPTWAVGFEIVRAKRIKKILSQTPVIPMTYVQGVGALDDYPARAVTVAGASPDNEYPDAQPQTTEKIYMPKNLFWPDPRTITPRDSTFGAGVTTVKKGETELKRNTTTIPLALVFPQNYMYDEGFALTGAEKLQTVDYVALQLGVTEYSSPVTAERSDTKIKGTFYALRPGDYYFDPTWIGKSITEDPLQIKGHTTFNNLDQPASLNGKRIMDYSALQTEGLDFGFEPAIQKGVVVDAPGFTHDIMFGTRTFATAGNMIGVSGGTPIFSTSPSLVYQALGHITNEYVNNYVGFVNNSSYVQAIKIANIVNEYNDDRYGNVDFQHEFISTGASYYFSEAELATVRAGGSLGIDLDVWGGDCFVSPHTFKISDGAYSVINQYKFHTPQSADSSAALIGRWGKYFINTSGAAIAMPIGIEAVAQFVTVVLESEYNGAVMAQDLLTGSGTNINGIPVLTPEGGEETLKSPLTYRYNKNLSKQNDEKVYFTRPAFSFERSDFPARLVFTDQKIYNTDEVGFDIFRVLNFLDLEESGGPVTKLAVETDNLYAIQEKSIVRLPAGETQISATDSGQLAVGISGFFGKPIIVDNKRGGQHLRSIVETGDVIYVPDNIGKSIYTLSGGDIQNISDLNNATLFREKFAASLNKRELTGIYDDTHGEYWIVGPNFAQRFNEKRKQWIGNYEFPEESLQGGVYTNQGLYLLGKISDQISVYTMYTGAANSLFGTVTTPRLVYVVNPVDTVTKKFTNQAYIASERLATADFIVEREVELADQVVSGTNIAVNSQGGNYRIKLPRAAGNEKLRGLRMIVTTKWKTDGSYSSLSSILTKYQLESRVPF
jgi:hypothetical protein